MKVHTSFSLVSTFVLLGLTACGPSHPSSGTYPGIQIGPDDTVLPQGERSFSWETQTEFFRYLRGSFVAMTEHMVRSAPKGPPQVAFYMESNLATDKLDRTVKTVELVHGDFGNIVFTKNCFYHRSFKDNLDTTSIGLANEEQEPAEMVSAPMPTESPTSFALLRVYRDGSNAVVVLGEYEASGKLTSAHVDHTHAGVRLFYPGDAVNLTSDIPRVGLPFLLGKDFFSTAAQLPAVPFAITFESLFTIMGDGKLIRMDQFTENNRHHPVLQATQFLQPSLVNEQKLLDPACNAQLATQRANELRTVE